MDLESFIVNKIDKLNTARNWSVYELSKLTGVNAQTIHGWFNQGSVPKISYIKECCDVFGITLADFFAANDMVELTPEKKALHDKWCALTESEKDAVKFIVKSYTDKK